MEETAAIHLIKKAVQFDQDKRYADALVCYTEGIELLLIAIKSEKFVSNRLIFTYCLQKIFRMIRKEQHLEIKFEVTLKEQNR
jgi:hypothetical protein